MSDTGLCVMVSSTIWLYATDHIIAGAVSLVVFGIFVWSKR